MGNYLKMQMTDKENLCQNIYKDGIIRSADCLCEFEKYAKLGNKLLPVTCYTNFRDALFHFRKMENCSEEHEIMQQAFAVREHSNRARTDAKLSVLLYYARVARCLMALEEVNEDIKKKLRVLMHKMKNVIMMSRIDGMMMSNVAINKVTDDEIADILAVFFDLVQAECLEQFTLINEQLGDEDGNCA